MVTGRGRGGKPSPHRGVGRSDAAQGRADWTLAKGGGRGDDGAGCGRREGDVKTERGALETWSVDEVAEAFARES
jgi:hypothetical protein